MSLEMFKGVICGLSACALWGLTYLLPVLLPSYDTAYIALSRALVMGSVSVIIYYTMKNQFTVLTSGDWYYATRISVIGNLLQAWFLMLSVQYAGVPIAGICFGGVPVLVALVSNAREKHRENAYVPISRLSIPLISIVIGFVLINFTELERYLLEESHSIGEFGFGLACGIISTLMWTWYPIRNADWLLEHPNVSPIIWTSAQCLILLPLSAFAYGLLYTFNHSMPTLLGPDPALFMMLMILAGFFCSWVATSLWNIASASLPTALVGQLLVFETIFAVIYGHIQRFEWPTATMLTGTTLLIAGISFALKTFSDLENQTAEDNH